MDSQEPGELMKVSEQTKRPEVLRQKEIGG